MAAEGNELIAPEIASSVCNRLTCVRRFLQWLGNSRYAAAGAKDVAADLVPLPDQAVLIGLADLWK